MTNLPRFQDGMAQLHANLHQGPYKKVLCVCSAGLLRSPTAAWVLSQNPFHYNTRSAGVGRGALIPLSPQLLTWADEVVIMEQEQQLGVSQKFKDCVFIGRKHPPVICLGIPDVYSYRDPELVEMISVRYQKLVGESE